MFENNFAISMTFIVYLVLMFAIGVFAYLRTSNSEDYFLGGRTLGPWSAALSAGASDMSGWLLLGLPGYAYAAGVESFWLAGGLLVGTYLNWLICAKRLRTYSIELDNALTIPEFLSRRFNDKSKLLQVISALFILVFFLFYTSSGLVAGGKLFESVFALDYEIAVMVGTACIVSYTFFGGFLAVSWTDLVQGLLMCAALMIVPIAIMDGEFLTLTDKLATKNPALLDIWTDIQGQPLSLMAIVSTVAWGLGYFGQPHILARFQATRTNKDTTVARRIAVSWTMLSMAGAILIGFVGIVYVDQHLAGELADSETIFMVLVNAVFHPVIAGILLAAILAAVMSTADSQLLVSSSALAEDFYKQLLRPTASTKEVMFVGRLAVIGISLAAMQLAMVPDSSVLELVSYAWAGFGAAFGPVLLLSLFWKDMNRNGALAGVIVGGVTVVAWKQVSGGIFDLYELVPGFGFAILAIVLVTKLTGGASAQNMQNFDDYQQSLKTLP